MTNRTAYIHMLVDAMAILLLIVFTCIAIYGLCQLTLPFWAQWAMLLGMLAIGLGTIQIFWSDLLALRQVLQQNQRREEILAQRWDNYMPLRMYEHWEKLPTHQRSKLK